MQVFRRSTWKRKTRIQHLSQTAFQRPREAGGQWSVCPEPEQQSIPQGNPARLAAAGLPLQSRPCPAPHHPQGWPPALSSHLTRTAAQQCGAKPVEAVPRASRASLGSFSQPLSECGSFRGSRSPSPSCGWESAWPSPAPSLPRLKSGVCRCVPERMGPFQARPRSLQNSVPGQTFCFPAGSARVAVGTRAPSGARHEVRPRQQPNSRGRTSLCGVTRSLGQFPPTLTHRPLTEGAEPHGGARAVYYLGHCARILEN